MSTNCFCMPSSSSSSSSLPSSNFGSGGSGVSFLNHNNNHNHNHNTVPTFTPVGLRHAPKIDDDAALARELNELSFQERETVLNDIHGVADIPVETPEFVTATLKEFDVELKNLPQKIRQNALDRALFLKPSILCDTNNKFKLLFLRAAEERYNAKQAVRRMAKYFDDKLELFGEDKLVQDITLETLKENKDDWEIYNSGCFVVLPHKDSVGRPIWFCDLSKFDMSRPKNLLRVSWYIMMATLEGDGNDDDGTAAQLKGVCNIQQCPTDFQMNIPMTNYYQVTVRGGEMLRNLPIRVTSYHFCYNNVGLAFVLAVFRRAVGKHNRLRLREHFGTELEIQYSLMTYGITCPVFTGDHQYQYQYHQNNNNNNTMNGGGNGYGRNTASTSSSSQSNRHQARMEIHYQYTVRRQCMEQARQEQMQRDIQQTQIFPYPPNSQLDVLVGRGRPYQNFLGNQQLHKLIRSQYLEAYKASTERFQKTCIHMSVTKAIQAKGGRFLERTMDGWKVVDDAVARRKVTSAFRSDMNTNTNNNDNNNNNNNGNGTIPLSDSSSAGESSSSSPPHNYLPEKKKAKRG